MNKLLLISILSLFFGCASIGLMSPELMARMEEFRGEELPFMIVAMYTGTPNSVGGVDAYVIPRITTPKTIKYVSMTFSAYNEVGDKVIGSIKSNNTFTGKVTGPLNFGDKVDWWKWGTAWYNNSIHCLKLTTVSVEYMDGDVKVYLEKELDQLYAPEELRIKGAKYWSCPW